MLVCQVHAFASWCTFACSCLPAGLEEKFQDPSNEIRSSQMVLLSALLCPTW